MREPQPTAVPNRCSPIGTIHLGTALVCLGLAGIAYALTLVSFLLLGPGALRSTAVVSSAARPDAGRPQEPA